MSAWQNDGNDLTGRVIIGAGVFALLALVIGFASGMYVGRSASPDLATLAGQVRQNAVVLSAQLAPAKAKYDLAVPNGTITNPTAYADAQSRIGRVKTQLATQNVSFEALAPGDYRRATAAMNALSVAASTPVPAREFDAAFTAALLAIGVLAGG